MDSNGPSKAIPKLVNARATFRDELPPFELSDIETWSCQAFCSTSLVALWASKLSTHSDIKVRLDTRQYRKDYLPSCRRYTAQWSTLEPRDFQAALVRPTAADMSWSLTGRRRSNESPVPYSDILHQGNEFEMPYEWRRLSTSIAVVVGVQRSTTHDTRGSQDTRYELSSITLRDQADCK
jgi:hypothetical protein